MCLDQSNPLLLLTRQYKYALAPHQKERSIFDNFFCLKLFKISVDLYLMLLERISQAFACLWHPLGPDWIM